MKEVKHYICEVCNTEYNEKSKAEDCEKGHIFPKSIKNKRYLPMKNNNKGYPISIDVLMENGDVVTYKR